MKILIKYKIKCFKRPEIELLNTYPQYSTIFEQRLIKANPPFFGTEEVINNKILQKSK